MKRVSAFLLAIGLGLAGCNEMSVDSLRNGLGRLNDLEDRTFATVQTDGAGRLVVVAPIEDLHALAQEARNTTLPGCLGKARNALVASIDQIILAQAPESGDAAMAEAWKRAAAYRNTAETCEKVLTF
jgi:hypothetical protein